MRHGIMGHGHLFGILVVSLDAYSMGLATNQRGRDSDSMSTGRAKEADH